MTQPHHPQRVGYDTTFPDRTESTANVRLPGGYRVDHHTPTRFMVRCSRCGRIHFGDDRGHAHRRADQHALQCDGCAGVTPVSKIEPDEDDCPSIDTGGLDPRRANLTGRDVSVRYQSVQGDNAVQCREVTVDRMLPGSDPNTWRGFEGTAANGTHLQVLINDSGAVVKAGETSPRHIGTLQGVQAASCGQPVATDGGSL